MFGRLGGIARRRQRLGYLAGFVLTVVGVFVLLLPNSERLSAAGPANTGHEDLACADCHDDAEGSPLQQINANIRYHLNMRSAPVDFVHQPVDNAVCIDCHEKPDDRHPSFRFEEPRFKDAREAIEPQFCVSCHLEHSGGRVTQSDIGFCVNCHEGMDLKNDPLDVSHAELVADERWDTCLACHDFHGNHVYEVPTEMAEMFDIAEVVGYLDGGVSPYGTDFVSPARTERTGE